MKGEIMYLENTNKKLNIVSLTKEINFTNSCVKTHFLSFLEWLAKHEIDIISGDATLMVNKNSIFWDTWLSSNYDAQQFLLQVGFAKKAVTFKPFTLTVETQEEAETLWHRLNMGETYIKASYRDDTSMSLIPYRDNVDTILQHFWDIVNKSLKEMK
jgi:hypothetical protein